MKNITVSVPDDVYREARVRAAEAGTSVSCPSGVSAASSRRVPRRAAIGLVAAYASS
jgi:hypothetical protein